MTPMALKYRLTMLRATELLSVVQDSLASRLRELGVEAEKTDPPNEALVRRIKRDSAAMIFIVEWVPPIVVSATEAYLQDALAASAEKDPALMRPNKKDDSSQIEQSAGYDEIVASASLDEIAGMLRHRWARNFLDRGGPTKWIERLTRMGARYPEDLGPKLEPLWGVRHMVTHNASVITLDFFRRHGAAWGNVGERIGGGRVAPLISESLGAATKFVMLTDKFLQPRFILPDADANEVTELEALIAGIKLDRGSGTVTSLASEVRNKTK